MVSMILGLKMFIKKQADRCDSAARTTSDAVNFRWYQSGIIHLLPEKCNGGDTEIFCRRIGNLVEYGMDKKGDAWANHTSPKRGNHEEAYLCFLDTA